MSDAPVLSLRVSTEALASLDASAGGRGISRSAMARLLLEGHAVAPRPTHVLETVYEDYYRFEHILGVYLDLREAQRAARAVHLREPDQHNLRITEWRGDQKVGEQLWFHGSVWTTTPPKWLREES